MNDDCAENSTSSPVRQNKGKKRNSNKITLPIADLNDEYDETTLKQKLTDAFKANKSISVNSLTLYNEPFQCCQLKHFLANDDFVQNLKEELQDLSFHQKDNDLYTFNQSDDLKNVKTPYIASFRSFLYSVLRDWMQDVTGFELNSTVDMSCACYDYTDALLCHDDQLEGRKIAYIFYIVPSWNESDGGTLDLIDCNECGEPSSIAKSICPEWNSFVFFEVSPRSFHQVSEVITEDKMRLSISGWFYGKSADWPLKDVQPLPPMLSATFIEEDIFYEWLNPQYLDQETQAEIRSRFEIDSEVELINFLNLDKFQDVAAALQADSLEWTSKGPLNRRYFDTMSNDKLPDVVKECLRVLHSEAMFLTLSSLTGLRLHELAEQNSSSDDEDDDGPKNKKTKTKETKENVDAKCYTDVRQFKYGCYTLLHENNVEVMDGVLDTMLFFNCNEWKEEYGGYISYLENDDNEELLRICPKDNSLALVFRDSKTLRFVKRINHIAKRSRTSSRFQAIWSIYRE